MKIINRLLVIILGTALALSCLTSQVYAASPSLSVQLLSATISGGSYSYSDSLNTSPGSEVTFYIELKNTTPSSTSSNTLIKLSLPDSFSSSANPTVSVTSSSGGGASDGTTVNFSSSSRLTLKSNTTELTWDRDGDGSKEFNGSKVGDSITSSGINIGDLQGGDSFVVQVITKANVEGGNGGSSGSASGGTSSLGSSSTPAPVKQNTCTESKPEKVTKVFVNKVSPTSVNIEWRKSSSANNYNLVYGLSSGDYKYGVNNLGDISKTEVNYLDPNANYYFAVLSINGCMPGELSNEVSTITQRAQAQPSPSPASVKSEVKAASIVSTPSPTPTPKPTPSPVPVVSKTQTLGWKLAKLTLPILLVTALFSLLFYVNNQISTSFIEKLDLDSKKSSPKKLKPKGKLTSWWLT